MVESHGSASRFAIRSKFAPWRFGYSAIWRFLGLEGVNLTGPGQAGHNTGATPHKRHRLHIFIIQANIDRYNFNLDSAHQAGQVRKKERNTGEHREPQADVEHQGWENTLTSQDPQPSEERGLRGHRKQEGLSVVHEDRARPSGEDGRSRHRPGGPPPSGRGARAPPELKSQKPPPR